MRTFLTILSVILLLQQTTLADLRVIRYLRMSPCACSDYVYLSNQVNEDT